MLEEHLGYVADRIRLEQFQAAIAAKINPGDRVADLGCGSGILGLLCLQAGAGRVYGIDSTPMLEVARETFARAGWGEQASFIRGHSHRVDLPERVDLVICDHVGYFGFDYDIAHTLQDARRRFLKPGGALIPAQIRLQLAAVESEAGRDKAEGWRAAGVPTEFHWLSQYTTNAKHAVELPRGRTGSDLAFCLFRVLAAELPGPGRGWRQGIAALRRRRERTGRGSDLAFCLSFQFNKFLRSLIRRNR